MTPSQSSCLLLSSFGIVENSFYFVAAGGGGAIFNPATRRRSEGNDASERISASRALMEFVIASSGMVLVIYELNPIAQFVLPKPFVPSDLCRTLCLDRLVEMQEISYKENRYLWMRPSSGCQACIEGIKHSKL